MGVNGSFHSANSYENHKNGCVSVLKEDVSILIKSEKLEASSSEVKLAKINNDNKINNEKLTMC